ncbi:MAG: hypothetical protein EOP51_01755 [Sphingobacteriales bacterium]|nr:MAG: hypothetical protein EOP51_01755 [Sphingobacteriales bacterium]
MYCISDQQVDYILNDIRRNGVEMEDLQLNLLDHICCIIEQNLKEGDDFELFYRSTIAQFYKKELREIEEETINLLTFKNYYSMRKFMFISGALSAVAFFWGSILKVMHWPGAAVMLLLGFTILSFVFLPLMFVLKTREMNTTRDKLVLGLGTCLGILYCLSMLFKIMHWPGARVMWITNLIVTVGVFLPAYFFTGIRKAETKVNTIVSSILLVGILGIQFSLTNLYEKNDTAHTYLQNEQLLGMMRHEGVYAAQVNTADKLAATIESDCAELKRMILKKTIGQAELPQDYLNMANFPEQFLGTGFNSGEAGYNKMMDLKKNVETYNTIAGNNKIPVTYTVLEAPEGKLKSFGNIVALNDLVQIQMFLAGNHSKMVAAN